jgi:hypothetical protein
MNPEELSELELNADQARQAVCDFKRDHLHVFNDCQWWVLVNPNPSNVLRWMVFFRLPDGTMWMVRSDLGSAAQRRTTEQCRYLWDLALTHRLIPTTILSVRHEHPPHSS